MKPLKSCAALAAALLVPVIATAETCPMSYEQFEYAVPHTDMEDCPDSINADGAYCRLTLAAELATVFVFSEETNCILSTKVYEEEQFAVTLP